MVRFLYLTIRYSIKSYSRNKNKIYQNYNGDLDKLHLSNSCEDISTKLVSDLKNTIKFLNLFRDFLKEINFIMEVLFGISLWFELLRLKINFPTERHQE